MKFEGRGDIKYIAALDRRNPTYKIMRFEPMSLIKGLPKVIEKDTSLETTIREIKKMTISQTESVKDLAARLYTGNTEQDCYHVWHWIKNNISYKLDPRGTERIRNPRASHLDQFVGVDCEDYSIFACCLLRCMNYKPEFVIVAFNGKPNFGHIYAQCEAFALDCVLGQFDQHPPNVTKREIIKVD
jgi:hypothetical protein